MGDLSLFIAGVLVTIPAVAGIGVLILAAVDEVEAVASEVRGQAPKEPKP